MSALNKQQWHLKEEHSHKRKGYEGAYEPHEIKPKRPEPKKISKEELFSRISQKPDPATVEAILQEEEGLWNS